MSTLERNFAELDTEPAGVGDAAKAADNFNVPAVPTPEQAKVVVQPDSSPWSLENFTKMQERAARSAREWQACCVPGPAFRSTMAWEPFGRSKSRIHLIRQDIVFQYAIDDEGQYVFSLYADASIEITDGGEPLFQGYVTTSDAGALLFVMEDAEGNEVAVSNSYRIELTADGDVILGHGQHAYLYDYDEEGNLLGMFDGDGNEYGVEWDEDGNYTISDAYGNTGEFYADGSYYLYDEEGNVFDEGGLFGEYDGDEEAAFDEEGDSDEEGDESWQGEDTEEETSGE